MIQTICVIAICLGLWLVALNWYCFYKAFVQNEPSPSWIPLLGGVLLCLGFYFYPGNSYKKWSFLAFAIDWGSVPGLLHAAYFHVRRIR